MEFSGFAAGPPRSLPDDKTTANPSTSTAAPTAPEVDPPTSATAPADLFTALTAIAADPSMSAAIPPNLLAEVMAFAENLPPGDNKVAWVLSESIIQGGFYSGKGSEIRLAVHIEALKYEIEGSLRDQISEMSQMLSSLRITL